MPSEVIVVIIVAAIVLALFGKKKVRCPRCGFQDRQKRFQDGRCPNCGSMEF